MLFLAGLAILQKNLVIGVEYLRKLFRNGLADRAAAVFHFGNVALEHTGFFRKFSLSEIVTVSQPTQNDAGVSFREVVTPVFCRCFGFIAAEAGNNAFDIFKLVNRHLKADRYLFAFLVGM